ncbi:TetR family transcriptional regulator [Sediminihabitans luteus]|uniref:TetR family transcriptional regulator n=1 Tax=Sediminihabitans luteus TaxID=1138585 RepID=A0A2M9CCB1_9CELL|nr:TetR/AcrR family transcriptional regulator [Sediminihabitans luteus]PJJ69017.1 TetR family transcriptional regulator [Sediminihabitans luteus]GII99403.1 hypothetical protein Slu03_17810 [Sediminihabitans luteus]
MSSPQSETSDRAVAGADGQRRMSRDERREQIVRAALGVFAAGGFHGTSTDQVARAAGVSQPYVVRMFRTKQELFREVFASVGDRIVEVFDQVPAGPDAKAQLGAAYTGLLSDRDVLKVLMHGFVEGGDPQVGRRAREVLVRAFETYVDRTGGTPEEARAFVAQGMLINTLLSVGAPEHTDEPGVAALVECSFGDALGAVGVAACRPVDEGSTR